jgi:single-strand DNA-binding protein
MPGGFPALAPFRHPSHRIRAKNRQRLERIMTDLITVTGLVATTPRHIVTGDGLRITTFRLASTQRKFDRNEQKWVDADTNWFTITSFRQLATNVVGSVQKGQRIVVTGRLRVRDWATEDKKGTNVEIDAEALGHDLSWGTATFTRSVAANLAESEAESAASGGGAELKDPAGDVESGDAESADVESGDGQDDDDEGDDDTRPAVLTEEPAAALPF